MKINGLLLAFFISLSIQAAAKSKTVTFINEDEKSSVTLTIRNMKTGKVIKSKNLSSKKSLVEKVPLIGKSFSFKAKMDIDYAIEANETDGDSLKTGVYSLQLRKHGSKGTVKIIRKAFLIRGEELVFVGDKEEDQKGAFVSKLLLTPDWAQR